MSVRQLKHKFVDLIPAYDQLESNVLYISIPCNIAVHKCPCGCGQEVATTIAPNRWSLLYNGKTVTLSPSIGNWYFECQSHYFIRDDMVVWAKDLPNDLKHATKKSWFFRVWDRVKQFK